MSYPYDVNPWDDSPSPNPAQQTGYQAGTTYTGYSNPMAQYESNSTSTKQELYANPADDQSQEPNQKEYTDNATPDRSKQSPINVFLRHRLPFYGAFLDFLDPITTSCSSILFKYVNRDLLVSKMFYFFFYSAFGSLFPLMGVYFKQLGMNPAQVGILTGVRPFIEIFSAPFWHSLAERFHKSKPLLLFSLLSWIVFTYSLAHIRPPASACIAFNDSDYVLYTPYSNNSLSNYEINQPEEKNEQDEHSANKLPSIEGKGVILASEENQNDQRRRRRRQVDATAGHIRRDRFSYEIDGASHDGYQSEFNIDLDLENDFEDKPVSGQSRSDVQLPSESELRSPPDQLTLDTAQNDHWRLQQNELRPKRSRRVERSLADDGEEEDSSTSYGSSEEASEDDESGDTVGENQNESSKRVQGETSAHDSQQLSSSQHSKLTAAETSEGTQASLTAGDKPADKTKRVFRQRHKTPPTHIVGMSPITVEYAVNFNKEKHGKFVTPMFSTIVYKLDDIKEVFFLLLLLISLGEFFSAPALTLADNATLGYLGENTDQYGRQRMFGSLSWAITLLLVGMALDNSTSIAGHPCGPHLRERSYTVCYIIFSLLMACAFLTATQFRFSYPKSTATIPDGQALMTKTGDGNTIVTSNADVSNIDELYASTRPRSIFNTAPPINAPPSDTNRQGGKENFEFLDKWKSAVFAQNTWEPPEWVKVFRQFKHSLHLMYLFITWFLGCGVGLVFTFLFWHLQDVGGTPTLFGICSVINHISEILAYFFSFNFIKRFGHTKVSI